MTSLELTGSGCWDIDPDQSSSSRAPLQYFTADRLIKKHSSTLKLEKKQEIYSRIRDILGENHLLGGSHVRLSSQEPMVNTT